MKLIQHASITLLSLLTSIPFAQAGGFFGGEPLPMDSLMDAIILERIHLGNHHIVDPIAHQEILLEIGNNENEDFILINDVQEEAFQNVITTVGNVKKPLSVKQILAILEWIRSLQFAKAFVAAHTQMLLEQVVEDLDLQAQLDILLTLLKDIHGTDLEEEGTNPEQAEFNSPEAGSWGDMYASVVNAGSSLFSKLWSPGSGSGSSAEQ